MHVGSDNIALVPLLLSSFRGLVSPWAGPTFRNEFYNALVSVFALVGRPRQTHRTAMRYLLSVSAIFASLMLSVLTMPVG